MLTPNDHEFLAGPFNRLEGWCYPDAAAIALYLQRYQLAQGWSAPNYEIGVFKGKYLSALHRAATLSGQRTTGIDIFRDEPRSLVQAGLDRELGETANLLLIEKDSATYSAAELNTAVGGPASWISVDGDHSAEGVYRDLSLAEATLAPWGVVALDDFINIYAIGVVVGSVRYLSSAETRLRPFCYGAGKLLLAFEEHVAAYHAQVPIYAKENQQYHMTGVFAQRMAASLHSWTTQNLFGYPTWVIA